MNELVELIVKKTGISEAMATTIVNLVINYLGKKLPAPFGSQINTFLNNEAAVEQAENILGGLVNTIEKSAKSSKASNKKK
jgi:hypothetical protein